MDVIRLGCPDLADGVDRSTLSVRPLARARPTVEVSISVPHPPTARPRRPAPAAVALSSGPGSRPSVGRSCSVPHASVGGARRLSDPHGVLHDTGRVQSRVVGYGVRRPGSETSIFRANPRPVRPAVGLLPLTQRTQVRTLHGSPAAGAAHPGPSCRPRSLRWTTHKESRHASPRGMT